MIALMEWLTAPVALPVLLVFAGLWMWAGEAAFDLYDRVRDAWAERRSER